jgi:hypothetical protein
MQTFQDGQVFLYNMLKELQGSKLVLTTTLLQDQILKQIGVIYM